MGGWAILLPVAHLDCKTARCGCIHAVVLCRSCLFNSGHSLTCGTACQTCPLRPMECAAIVCNAQDCGAVMWHYEGNVTPPLHLLHALWQAESEIGTAEISADPDLEYRMDAWLLGFSVLVLKGINYLGSRALGCLLGNFLPPQPSLPVVLICSSGSLPVLAAFCPKRHADSGGIEGQVGISFECFS